MLRDTLPFVKWPGGKRWLVRHLLPVIADIKYDRYVEPFLGGGAIFFALQPKRALISDVNADLINAYRQVRDHPEEVVLGLKEIPVNKEHYLLQRKSHPAGAVQRAIRFLYLNRTAFGGMYRVNQQGEFNVPFGGGERTPEPLWRDNYLVGISKILKNAELGTADFARVLSHVGAGDLVYCDPTYTTVHNNGAFVRYNEKNFSWKDQRRLARAGKAAVARGATVIVSNACSSEIAGLYQEATIITLNRKTLLCPNPAKRGAITEYLIVLKPTTVTSVTGAQLGSPNGLQMLHRRDKDQPVVAASSILQLP